MPPKFSKIVSPELTFWLETGVSGATNLVKMVKIGLEIQDFFSKNGSEVSGAGKGLEKVGV